MKKVSILYGWAEGPGLGKKLRQELRKNGFSITSKAEDADIIIAHSGGVFLVPKIEKPQIVLLVGLPHWPGKHPVRGLRQKVKADLKSQSSIKVLVRKTFYNILYFIFRPFHHLRIYGRWRRKIYPKDRTNSFVAVRNRHDTFMHPEGSVELAAQMDWQLLSLDGQHDDIWYNPEAYVGIIKKLSA